MNFYRGKGGFDGNPGTLGNCLRILGWFDDGCKTALAVPGLCKGIIGGCCVWTPDLLESIAPIGFLFSNAGLKIKQK